MICPSSATHADWTELVAPFGAHVLVEKPFAANLEQADRMIAALKATGKQLIINWPLRWYPCHITAKRLIDEDVIGELEEVHYYDGNRGPLSHIADKVRNRGDGRGPGDELVVQEGCRRRIAARLSRLRRHARHMVSQRTQADRGDHRHHRHAGA